MSSEWGSGPPPAGCRTRPYTWSAARFGVNDQGRTNLSCTPPAVTATWGAELDRHVRHEQWATAIRPGQRGANAITGTPQPELCFRRSGPISRTGACSTSAATTPTATSCAATPTGCTAAGVLPARRPPRRRPRRRQTARTWAARSASSASGWNRRRSPTRRWACGGWRRSHRPRPDLTSSPHERRRPPTTASRVASERGAGADQQV